MIDALIEFIRVDHPLWGAVVFLGVGLVALIVGAEGFVAGSVKISNRVGLPRVTVGLTLVAIGTSLPELGASLAAILEDDAGGTSLALGNALGSNSSNIGFLFGLSALIAPIIADPIRSRPHLAVMVGAACAFGVLAWAHGSIGRLAGIVGLIVFFAYTLSMFRSKFRRVGAEGDGAVDQKPGGHVVLDLLLFGGGCTMVLIGADLLVLGASSLAEHLGVSPDVIGAALVAVGTSVPELAVCLSAARRREGDILVGNLIGSNIANLLLVVATCAVVVPLPARGQILGLHTPVMLIFSVLMAVPLATGGRAGRTVGFVLLGLYLAYQGILWTRP